MGLSAEGIESHHRHSSMSNLLLPLLYVYGTPWSSVTIESGADLMVSDKSDVRAQRDKHTHSDWRDCEPLLLAKIGHSTAAQDLTRRQ